MIRVTLALLFGSVLLLEAQVADQPPAQVSKQQTITDAAAQLAARISSLLPRRATVSLEIQNLTPNPGAEWSKFRNLLQDELRKAGVETAATRPEPGLPLTPSRVRVTLSEDARGLLFVAEVSSGDTRQIALLPWNLPSPASAKPRISITRKPLWTQAEPMLDTLLMDSDSRMLILSPDKVVSYRLLGDKWTPSATASLVLARPLPRDPRGRLETTADGFRAYLPTATCQGTFTPELRLTCVNGTETWPEAEVRWVADRNLLESDAIKASFFSSGAGLFATADGRVQDRQGQPVLGSEGWGSDIAGIDDPCGGGAVIASASGEREEIRVYEVANGQATPASDALPLPGPVSALWQAESAGRLAASSATLVVHNVQTGQYEASRLGLACTE
jgi:hypothetical protein